MGTKGTWQRPPSIPETERESKWERTFPKVERGEGKGLPHNGEDDECDCQACRPAA